MTKEKLKQFTIEGNFQEVFYELSKLGAKDTDAIFHQLRNEFIKGGTIHTDFSQRIGAYIDKFFQSLNPAKTLQVVVCALSEEEARQIPNQTPELLARYGQRSLDWKPFGEESIEILLQEYETKAFPLIYEAYEYGNEVYEHELSKAQDNAIFVIDIQALWVYPETFATFNTTQPHRPLFLFPLCASYDATRKQILEEIYTDIELCVSTKQDFFRRISNMANTCFGMGNSNARDVKKHIITTDTKAQEVQNSSDKSLIKTYDS
jgi:hypothetical protein